MVSLLTESQGGSFWTTGTETGKTGGPWRNGGDTGTDTGNETGTGAGTGARTRTGGGIRAGTKTGTGTGKGISSFLANSNFISISASSSSNRAFVRAILSIFLSKQSFVVLRIVSLW